jgi:hypothetical protein
LEMINQAGRTVNRGILGEDERGGRMLDLREWRLRELRCYEGEARSLRQFWG